MIVLEGSMRLIRMVSILVLALGLVAACESSDEREDTQGVSSADIDEEDEGCGCPE